MKTLPVLFVVAVLALLLSALFLGRGKGVVPGFEPEQGASPVAPGPQVDGSSGIEMVEGVSIPASLDSRTIVGPASQVEVPAATAWEGSWTRVEGHVVDQEGTPLVGARVQLRIYREPEGAELSELIPLGNERYTRRSNGIEEVTDAQGQFGIDAPFGTKTLYRLQVAADRFHDSASIRFGNDGVQPVVEGLVDAGEIRLAVTGSVFGSVSDVRGQPVVGAEMDTGPGRSTTYSRGSVTGEDGSFVIPHARVGTYMVKAEFEGLLSKEVEDVTVKAGEDTGPIDIVLEDASRIEGRIVDEAGAPIEGVRLWGWPESSGSGAGAKTTADGSFVVYLPQAEPYTMQATHPDYEQWGDDSDHKTMFEPGARIPTITLARLSQVSFTVADEASGEPLSSYGLFVARNEGSEATSSGTTFHRLPGVKDHPGGVLKAGATPRRDGYVAYAKGYLMKEGDVEPTEESVAAGAPAQRVLLNRGAGVEGRLMKDGEPVAGVPIDFTPGSEYQSSFSPQERLAFQIQSGPDGRFRTTGLKAAGKTRLTATPPAGAAALVLMLEGLKGGEVRDLGDLEFLEGGTVLGRVLLPEEVEPGGITVYRGNWKEDVNQVTDSAGVFRFENVPAGEHTFGQRGRPEILSTGGIVSAVVNPGQVTEVVLDLRDQVLVDVELDIDLGGRSAAGLSVNFLLPVPEGPERDFVMGTGDRVPLGRTNEDGVVRANCRAVKGARVEVRLPHGQRLLHDGDPLNVEYGPPFSDRVSFKFGTLIVELGESNVLPREGKLRVEIREPGGTLVSTQFISHTLVDGAFLAKPGEWATLEGTTATIHGIEAGTWDVTVYATKADAPRVTIELPSGGTRRGAERDFTLTANVTVGAGETVRIGDVK